MARLQKGRTAPRDRVLGSEELRRVLRAAENLGRYGQLCRFLIYTGQRWGQAKSLTRNHIGQDQTLHWPSEQMKVPKSGGHTIPYGPLTAQLLAEAQIPFTKAHHYHDKLVKAAGVDLRHVCAEPSPPSTPRSARRSISSNGSWPTRHPAARQSISSITVSNSSTSNAPLANSTSNSYVGWLPAMSLVE